MEISSKLSMRRKKDSLSSTRGAYSTIAPWLTIEAPERTSSRSLQTVFEHEFVHKFLFELTEAGVVVRSISLTIGENESEIHAGVQKIMSCIRSLHETFATNVEVLRGWASGINRSSLVSDYPDDYKQAYDALRDLHPFLYGVDEGDAEDAVLLILLLGLRTLGFPLFGVLGDKEVAEDESWVEILDDLDVLLEKRFAEAKRQLFALLVAKEDLKEVRREYEQMNDPPWCVVNQRAIRKYLAKLDPSSKYASVVRRAIVAYHDDENLLCEELYERVRQNAVEYAAAHFNVRIPARLVHASAMQQFVGELLKAGTFVYIHCVHNSSKEIMKHGLVIQPDQTLVMCHGFANVAELKKYTEVDYEPGSTALASGGCSLASFEEAKTLINTCLGESNALISGQLISFDMKSADFMGVGLNPDSHVFLTMPFLSVRSLSAAVRELAETSRFYLMQVVYVDEEGSSFLCIRP